MANARRRSLYSVSEGRIRRTPELNFVSLAVLSQASGAAAITYESVSLEGKGTARDVPDFAEISFY